MTLNDLPQDVWMMILQFFTIEDMLQSNHDPVASFQKNQEEKIVKLFGVSRIIFSSLLGNEIDQFNAQDCGGIFYRVLNEKLVIRQLELVIDRIVNRPIFVNSVGENDYEEETNSHNYKPLMEKQRINDGNIRRTRVRRRYFIRSRLNVLSNNQSMSKLRRELRGLIMKSQEQFPHIYEEYKNRIENALQRSIKICTIVEKPVNNSDNINYEDNSNTRPEKPVIWNEEKRRKSIEISFKCAKNVKNHQWRIQWHFNYSNHLRHELEFNLNYLDVYHNLLYKNYIVKEEYLSIENYISLVDNVLELVFKFGKDFQEKFFTTRNFFKKRKVNRFRNNAEYPLKLEKHLVDFIYQTISCLSKSYGFFNEYYAGLRVLDTSIEQMFNLIERLMDIHLYFNRNNTVQEYCYGKSIYNLLIRFDRKIFEKYTRNNEIHNLPQHLQESFLISCTKYSSFVPVELLKSLDLPLKILKLERSGSTQRVSLGNFILVINDSYRWYRENSNLWLAEWLNILIDKYGKQELLGTLDETLLFDMRINNVTHYTTLKDIFGKELEEKIKHLSEDFE